MNIFSFNYRGKPLEFFGLAQLAALGAISLLNLYQLRFRGRDEAEKRCVRTAIAVILLQYLPFALSDLRARKKHSAA